MEGIIRARVEAGCDADILGSGYSITAATPHGMNPSPPRPTWILLGRCPPIQECRPVTSASMYQPFSRFYREERLQVRQRVGRKPELGTVRHWLNQRWCKDFLSDAFAEGRRSRILGWRRRLYAQCLALIADTSSELHQCGTSRKLSTGATESSRTASTSLHKPRRKIENAFDRLKDFWRITTRYDKVARNYLAFVCLAAASTCGFNDFGP